MEAGFPINFNVEELTEVHLLLFSRICFIAVYCLFPPFLSQFKAVFLQYRVSAIVSILPDLLKYPNSREVVVIYECPDWSALLNLDSWYDYYQ